MSDDLYTTRLRWTGGRGIAKLRGEQVRLLECPQLFDGVVIDAIDYAPEVNVRMYMPRFGGWRDFDNYAQVQACDDYLERLLGRRGEPR